MLMDGRLSGRQGNISSKITKEQPLVTVQTRVG
jgi:hypothetical protein